MYTALISENLGLASGTALAHKLDGRQRVVVAFGEGDAAAGEKAEFHEAINFAAVNRLPLIVVIENNEMGQHTPASTYLVGTRTLRTLLPGIGIPGVIVDGQDVIAVHDAVQVAVTAPRGRGDESDRVQDLSAPWPLRGRPERLEWTNRVRKKKPTNGCGTGIRSSSSASSSSTRRSSNRPTSTASARKRETRSSTHSF